MSHSKIRIGISLRIVESTNYIEKRDALSHDWPPLIEKLNALPIFIPNALTKLDEFLEDIQMDGLVLSGGDDIGKNLLGVVLNCNNYEKIPLEVMTLSEKIIKTAIKEVNKLTNGTGAIIESLDAKFMDAIKTFAESEKNLNVQKKILDEIINNTKKKNYSNY